MLPKEGCACVPCVEKGNGCVSREIFVLFGEVIVFSREMLVLFREIIVCPREMLVVPKEMVVFQGRYLCFLRK